MGGLSASRESRSQNQAFTRFWGWSQAIASSLGVVAVLGYLFHFGTELRLNSRRIRILPDYKLQHELWEIGAVFINSAVLLACLLLGLLGAVLLLVGSYKNKPMMIYAWMNITFSLMCGGAAGFIQYLRSEFVQTSYAFGFGYALGIVFTVVAFVAVVVYMHSEDIKSSFLKLTQSDKSAMLLKADA